MSYNLNKDCLIIIFDDFSTDFTTYHNNALCNQGSWEMCCGFHNIVDSIVEYALTNCENHETNISNIRVADEISRTMGIEHSSTVDITYAVYCGLNDYLIFQRTFFDVDVRFADLIPLYAPRMKTAFEVSLNKPDMDYLISKSVAPIIKAIHQSPELLKNLGLSPQTVCMASHKNNNYIRLFYPYIKKTFPNAQILLPNATDCVFSDGAALYAQRKYHTKSFISR